MLWNPFARIAGRRRRRIRMLGNPVTFKGGASWLIFGLVAAAVALTIGHFLPGIIPTRARTQTI